MSGTQIKLSKRMLFTWCLLSSLIIFLAPQSFTNQFQFAFAIMFRFPLNFGRTMRLSVQPRRSLEGDISREQYIQLQNHLANVIGQLNQMQQQVEKLSGLRGKLPWEGVGLELAGVITTSGQGAARELIIDRGSNKGVKEGHYVVGDNSIIGTVCEVSSNSSRVRLITDSASRLPIEIGPDQAEGLMHGTGDGAKIPLIPAKVSVRAGDLIYAARRGGRLPSPMVTAVVTEAQRDQDNPLVWDIAVEPATDIDSLSDVAVIILKN